MADESQLQEKISRPAKKRGRKRANQELDQDDQNLDYLEERYTGMIFDENDDDLQTPSTMEPIAVTEETPLCNLVNETKCGYVVGYRRPGATIGEKRGIEEKLKRTEIMRHALNDHFEKAELKRQLEEQRSNASFVPRIKFFVEEGGNTIWIEGPNTKEHPDNPELQRTFISIEFPNTHWGIVVRENGGRISVSNLMKLGVEEATSGEIVYVKHESERNLRNTKVTIRKFLRIYDLADVHVEPHNKKQCVLNSTSEQPTATAPKIFTGAEGAPGYVLLVEEAETVEARGDGFRRSDPQQFRQEVSITAGPWTSGGYAMLVPQHADSQEEQEEDSYVESDSDSEVSDQQDLEGVKEKVIVVTDDCEVLCYEPDDERNWKMMMVNIESDPAMHYNLSEPTKERPMTIQTFVNHYKGKWRQLAKTVPYIPYEDRTFPVVQYKRVEKTYGPVSFLQLAQLGISVVGSREPLYLSDNVHDIHYQMVDSDRKLMTVKKFLETFGLTTIHLTEEAQAGASASKETEAETKPEAGAVECLDQPSTSRGMPGDLPAHLGFEEQFSTIKQLLNASPNRIDKMLEVLERNGDAA